MRNNHLFRPARWIEIRNWAKSSDNWIRLSLPFFFVVYAEHSFNNCGHVKTTNIKCERSRPIWRNNGTIFHSKIIKWIVEICVVCWFIFEANELPIIFEDKIPRSPVSYMFTFKYINIKIKKKYQSYVNVISELIHTK